MSGWMVEWLTDWLLCVGMNAPWNADTKHLTMKNPLSPHHRHQGNSYAWVVRVSSVCERIQLFNPLQFQWWAFADLLLWVIKLPRSVGGRWVWLGNYTQTPISKRNKCQVGLCVTQKNVQQQKRKFANYDNMRKVSSTQKLLLVLLGNTNVV